MIIAEQLQDCELLQHFNTTLINKIQHRPKKANTPMSILMSIPEVHAELYTWTQDMKDVQCHT